MRLKEIKPGMVIHCKNYEERKALLEEAERLGYVWYNTKARPTDYINIAVNTIHFYDAGTTPLSTDYKYIAHSCNTDDATIEFSDLILPELTAEEAIKINTQLCAGTCDECPLYNVDGYSDCDDLCINNTEKAVEILAQWKSDHEKKEPEIGLREAAKPLVDYLRKNYHPHVTAVVSLTDVEVLEGKEVAKYE